MTFPYPRDTEVQQERHALIIKLYLEGKTSATIAEMSRTGQVSVRKIIKKWRAENEKEA